MPEESKKFDFDLLLNWRLKEIRKVLKSKEVEYAKRSNRFHNFEQAAMIDGEEPEQALWGMMKKHLVSVQDMKDNPTRSYSPQHISEKIGDTINYLILLEGLLKRRGQR